MQEGLRPVFAALATAGVVSSAHGVSLGDLQVQSALGQRLEARVRVVAAPGETVEASCFSVLPGVPQGLSGVPNLQVTLEPAADVLRLTSLTPVHEPAAALALRAACPGSPSESMREYVLLLDPLPTGTSAVIRARRGETLESLARALVQAPGPRREYLVAVRAANPRLAGVGDREALAEGTTVVLPDLRTAARAPAHSPSRAAAPAPRQVASTSPVGTRPADPPSSAVDKAVAQAAAPPRARSEAPAPPAPASARTAQPRAEPSAPAPAARTEAPKRQDFVLKLSSSEVNLAPTREVNDAQRQQLRERLLLLDSDDQVSALLAMRHSLKQLESRVAELQLKLAAMPQSFPERLAAPKAEAPAPKMEVPAAKVEAPAAKVEAPAPKMGAPVPKVEAPTPAPQPTPAPPQPSPPPVAPESQATPPVAEPAPPETPRADVRDKRAPKPAPPAPPFGERHLPDWWWAAAAGLLLVAAWFALRLRRRQTPVEAAPTDIREAVAPAPQPEGDSMDLEVDAMPAPPARHSIDSDATLATRLSDNSGDLRRRYIEERFPEVINGTIRLDDPDSVVKGARLFFEDGAMTRAVELLQFAIEDHPGAIRLWLALFEIFRLERLAGEYAELASRFAQHHGGDDAWRKVRYFGRELDPGNALYREAPVNTLETIGPRESRKLAGSLEVVDPIAENWLNAPMDFENEVLANELRNALMAQAQLTEQDLAPNPMPALRKVEMFTVA